MTFWKYCDCSGTPDACWRWRGTFNGHGYGQIKPSRHAIPHRGVDPQRREEYAHRVAYILSKGEIPEGMLVMHSCDNRWCVNPAHLSVGTTQQNAADRFRKGRTGKLHDDWHQLSKSTCADVADDGPRGPVAPIVIEFFDQHPQFTSAQIAAHLGLHPAYVRCALKRNGRKLVHQAGYFRA